MESRKEKRNEQKKARFQIEKLEERIAPGGHCAILGGVPAAGQAAAGLATAQNSAGCCNPATGTC